MVQGKGEISLCLEQVPTENQSARARWEERTYIKEVYSEVITMKPTVLRTIHGGMPRLQVGALQKEHS